MRRDPPLPPGLRRAAGRCEIFRLTVRFSVWSRRGSGAVWGPPGQLGSGPHQRPLASRGGARVPPTVALRARMRARLLISLGITGPSSGKWAGRRGRVTPRTARACPLPPLLHRSPILGKGDPPLGNTREGRPVPMLRRTRRRISSCPPARCGVARSGRAPPRPAVSRTRRCRRSRRLCGARASRPRRAPRRRAPPSPPTPGPCPRGRAAMRREDLLLGVGEVHLLPPFVSSGRSGGGMETTRRPACPCWLRH
jgi:hypothetical protein